MVRITTSYLPPLAFFQAFWLEETVTIEACEHYQKGAWRNRCMIAGPNGAQRLSIPLEKGKHQQTPIRDVRISYHENWQLIHWRSIKTAYGNAPYFEHYADQLVRFYEKKEVFLFDYNLALFDFLVKKTGWKGRILLSENYAPVPDLPEIGIKPYPQVFQDRYEFMGGLSVLDALMCGQKIRSLIE